MSGLDLARACPPPRERCGRTPGSGGLDGWFQPGTGCWGGGTAPAPPPRERRDGAVRSKAVKP